MKKTRLVLIMSLLTAAIAPGIAHSATDGVARAGIGIADATWHVGTGSGQYADKDPNATHIVTGDDVDPYNHGMSQSHSYGVASRLTYRALVVEGANGKRIALVKSDSYLAQDMLTRRVGQILAKDHSSIGFDQILLHVTHNHSSPYYTSPAWGVWLFQDMFDIRTYEYHARAMASAIEQAENSMVPVRMGATTIRDTIYKGVIAHAGLADDGTPKGYPETATHACPVGDANPLDCVGQGGYGDFDDTVVRFDDVSNPEAPKPLAIWMNHGQHPESLDGYDLITADYLGPLERDVFRQTGAQLVFSQADVGSSEGPYLCGGGACNERLADGVLRAWAHVGHAQTERGARYLADLVIKAWNNIGSGDALVPFSSDFAVDSITAFVPGPISHPYPSVSNCRTASTVNGNPGSPIIGLPDCQRADLGGPDTMVMENLKEEGLPVPEHYDAPSHGAVEENLRLKLQAFKMGEVLLASCACEAQVDLIRNLESRTDATTGNINDGYDWGANFCSHNTDTTWTCSQREIGTHTYSDALYQHMEAQVHNDAKGWNEPENAVAANAEPADPSKIWGNFTKEELPATGAGHGFVLPVGVGHAGDYNGYTVSYREYMGYDHYRKALTSYGAHTADYMVTNLVHMAAALNGGPAFPPVPASPTEQADQVRMQATMAADEARQVAESTSLGILSEHVYDTWLASLPNDKGDAAVLAQPSDITRFNAATFSWRGGDNAVDNPRARVERLVDGNWVTFADQSGEVQTMVQFPKGAQGVADTYAGNQEWKWTANFEAFDAFPRTVVPGGQTPAGTYRFVVDGLIRHSGSNGPYHFESNAFDVKPWGGITVGGITRESNGDVSFALNDSYPRSYNSPWRYIHDDGNTLLCRTCAFRPWASAGQIATATVTVTRAGGAVETVPATLTGGRWVAAANLAAGDSAQVLAGSVLDTFGETNGSSSAAV